jgi:hypothetical protein
MTQNWNWREGNIWEIKGNKSASEGNCGNYYLKAELWNIQGQKIRRCNTRMTEQLGGGKARWSRKEKWTYKSFGLGQWSSFPDAPGIWTESHCFFPSFTFTDISYRSLSYDHRFVRTQSFSPAAVTIWSKCQAFFHLSLGFFTSLTPSSSNPQHWAHQERQLQWNQIPRAWITIVSLWVSLSSVSQLCGTCASRL